MLFKARFRHGIQQPETLAKAISCIGLANMGIEGISKVILFGSVAKHTASVDSDIDVAIVTDVKNPRLEADVSVMCGGIQERFKREIQPHFLTEEEFSAKTKLAEEIRKDGVVLI